MGGPCEGLRCTVAIPAEIVDGRGERRANGGRLRQRVAVVAVEEEERVIKGSRGEAEAEAEAEGDCREPRETESGGDGLLGCVRGQELRLVNNTTGRGRGRGRRTADAGRTQAAQAKGDVITQQPAASN